MTSFYATTGHGWDVALAPGELVTEGGTRNAGPAIRLSDGADGGIIAATDKHDLIATLEAMLDKARRLPDPEPPTPCANCGRPTRHAPHESAARQAAGEREWVHVPTEDIDEPVYWEIECWDFAGEVPRQRITGPDGHRLLATPTP